VRRVTDNNFQLLVREHGEMMSTVPSKPSNILPAQQLRTASEWLDEAQKILRTASVNGSFPREAQGKFESLMAMHAACRGDSWSREQYNVANRNLQASRTLDPGTLAFFSSSTPREALSSESGTCIESRMVQGHGSVTELRTYAALSTSTSGDGAGLTIPLGMHNSVDFALRQFDGIFDCSRRVTTPTGNTLDWPMAIESNVGTKLSEGSTVNQTNPAFSQTQLEADTYSSDQIVTSLAFLQDCGAPNTAALLTQVFAIRIALNMGTNFVTDLLSSAHIASTAASPTAITPAEVTALIGKVSNAAYAFRPRSGWLMNASTYNYLTSLTAGAGNNLFVFPRKKNADGMWTLLDYPVWLSPNMSSIGAGATTLAFGDWDKHVIRQVEDSMTFFRYNEKYMSNYSVAFQAYWRASSALLTADAGASDWPIVLLRQPLS
jgi:HK97 family phage major capsid protein